MTTRKQEAEAAAKFANGYQVEGIGVLAAMLGVGEPEIRTRVARGMPCLSRGSRHTKWLFDLPAVFAWWVASEVAARAPQAGKAKGAAPAAALLDPAQEKARRDRAAAELAELRLGQERGRWVAVEAVARVLSGELAALRSRLLALPSRVAPLYASTRTPQEAHALVAREVNDALEELSSAEELSASASGASAGDVREEERERSAGAAH